MNTSKNGFPCIYMITNTANNKIYIGSTIGQYRRKAQHI
jgi:predicted GIY-YIG superfamily endonuclease